MDTHEYISRAGGGRAVINLMSHSSLEVRREASRCVSNLLSSFRHQAAVIEMGIQALLALVDADDDECSYHVALSLRKLSPNLKSHPVIVYAGGFDVLFRLIESNDFNTVKQAAAALRDLCANPDYKTKCAEDGGIAALVRLTKQNVDQIQSYAFAALRHLSLQDSLKEPIIAEKALHPVAMLAPSGSEDLQLQVNY